MIELGKVVYLRTMIVKMTSEAVVTLAQGRKVKLALEPYVKELKDYQDLIDKGVKKYGKDDKCDQTMPGWAKLQTEITELMKTQVEIKPAKLPEEWFSDLKVTPNEGELALEIELIKKAV